MVGAAQAQAPNPSVCDRTHQVRDAIVALLEEEEGISDCSEVTTHHLSEWGRLDGGYGPPSYRPLRLDGTGITELKRGDFSGLSSTTKLHLQNNSLTILPDSIFHDMNSLSTLQLYNNQLIKLPEVAFSDLAGLYRLDLRNNLITTISEDVFKNIEFLRILNLNGNHIETLSDDAFVNFRYLYSLSLGDNPFTTLPAGVFMNLWSLTELHIENGNLVMLPDSVFKNLINLQEMRLNNNHLEILSPNVFAGLKDLWFLEMKNNRLAKLPSGVFSNLDSLKYLDLRDNRFEMLPTGIFEGIDVLQGQNENEIEIMLHGNPGYPFTAPVEIHRINGDIEAASPAEVVVRIDSGTPFLYQTTLEVTGGDAFPEEITIEPGALESAPVTITQDPAYEGAVKVLLTEEPDPYIFRRFELAVQFVTNPLVLFPGAIIPNPAVCDRTSQVQETLIERLGDVSECGEISGEDLVSLEGTMLLPDLGIEVLKRGDFAGLGSLKALHLNGNQFTTLPDSVFLGLYSLSRLYLNNNRLTTLMPHTFAGLKSLRVLRLHDNDIAALPKGVFSGLTKLTELWLYNNQLTELPDNMFAGLKSLTTLSLRDNPGTPFQFVLEVIRTDDDPDAAGPAKVAIRVFDGMPLWGKPSLSLSAAGGSVKPEMVTLEPGTVVSTPATVTRDADNRGTVEVGITQVDPGPLATGVSFIRVPLVLFEGALDPDGPETETTEELPEEVSLSANYPNPFNPGTTIHYALPAAATLRLAVYDVLGREVAVLADGVQAAGRHTVRFDAGHLPSGTYVVRLDTDEQSIVRTMTLSR